MRTLLLAASGALVAIAMPSLAQTNPPSSWCAQYEEIGRNCGFTTLQQCMAAQLGNGGYCEPNPLGVLPTPPERAKRARRPQRRS
jgi:hypothetical protein